MNILAEVTHGSRLYGTNNPSSDVDLKFIFIPTLRECYTQTIKDSFEVKKNGNDEVYYSIQKFLDMAITGQPVAIEMLWAPLDKVHINSEESSFLWYKLSKYRKRFLTKKMSAFLGFAKSLSNKYAVKAERINALDELINQLESYANSFHRHNNSLRTIWESLPLNEFCKKETDIEGRVFYEVLSRKYRDNTSVKDFLFALKSIRADYGERVRAAQEGKFDTKSVSHSFRICYQLNQIATTGELIFPLREADFLRKLKNGELSYERDDIFNRLEDEMHRTEELLEKSNLPDSVDSHLHYEILDFFYENN